MDSYLSVSTADPTSARKRLPSFLRMIGVLLLLALAGCGVANTAGGSANQSTASHTPASSIPATTQPNAAACPGGMASASDVGTPALVIGVSTRQHQGTAPGGALVQIQLPTQLRWSPVSVHSTGPNAQILPPAGYFDPTLGACIWDIRMPPSGTVTLTVTGSGSCAKLHGCPPYFMREMFTITVQ